MISTLILVAVIAQPAVQTSSPLLEQADELARTPADVRYEFIKQVIPNFGFSIGEYRATLLEQQVKIAMDAYYLKSLSRALLIYNGDPELVAILETLGPKLQNSKEVALRFESTYKNKFNRWPPIVPVNVDELITRMLDENTVR